MIRDGDFGMRLKIDYTPSRATGIATYIETGGILEKTRKSSASGPRTSKLDDRTGDELT
jgi:hypothetical protein